MMKFDKKAPGGGVSALCSLENGKAVLEWQINCGETDEYPVHAKKIQLRLVDAQENVVLECFLIPAEEEPLQAVLLQPCLWNSTTNPHLYRLEATMEDEYGNRVDSMVRLFPLRSITMQKAPVGGEAKIFLNGESFQWKTVRYEMPGENLSGEGQRLILEELGQLVDLGINSIMVQKEEITEAFLQLCDRMGLLLVAVEDEKIWVSGEEFEVEQDGESPLDFRQIPVFPGKDYLYKAKWSKKPFVYIVPESLKRLESGNYAVTCYSNCRRLALYSEGRLFEFQQGQEVFTFQEIPAKGPCIILTAEGDGCSTSLSVHKTFTKLSPNGDN